MKTVSGDMRTVGLWQNHEGQNHKNKREAIKVGRDWAIINPATWLSIQANILGRQTNTMTYVGVPGTTNVVQYTTNLLTGPWVPMVTNMPAANGIGTVQDTSATDVQRFYQVTTP